MEYANSSINQLTQPLHSDQPVLAPQNCAFTQIVNFSSSREGLKTLFPCVKLFSEINKPLQAVGMSVAEIFSPKNEYLAKERSLEGK